MCSIAVCITQVAQAIAAAVEQGLNLPIVYNTSAYDGLASLHLMEGLVDVYMPDFKFWTNEAAYKYAKARDYPDAAKAAILEMHRQVRPGPLDEAGAGAMRHTRTTAAAEVKQRCLCRACCVTAVW
jgi:putative pyruvate formate lyase activating enzyme